MKCKSIRMACAVAAALLLAACTNDELAEQGTALPYGKYPLEISGVTLDVESSSEPWNAKTPQTRVTENTDGMSSEFEWDGSEKISVRIGDGKSGTYILESENKVTAETPCYWASKTQGQTVTAWYPADGTVSLANQEDKLAYVLHTTETADFNQTVTLNFSHDLAKVRVLLTGTYDMTGGTVQVWGSKTATIENDELKGSNEGWITMHREVYDDGTVCYEANIIPATLQNAAFHVKAKDDKETDITLEKSVELQAGQLSTITLTVNQAGTETIDLASQGDCNVEANKSVVIDGKGQQFTKKITIGKGARVMLKNVKLNTADGDNNYPIEVTGSATLIFSGDNEITANGQGSCAIKVSGKGHTLTIDGTIDDKLKLTATAAYSVGLCAAEGANLVINGGTIEAKGGPSSAAIGGEFGAECGNITINGGNITAYGGASAAAIGSGADNNGSGSCGDIIITGGDITATGGINAAGIGGGMNAKCGDITISGGYVYAEGGDSGSGIGGGDCQSSLTITGGTVIAKGSGNSQGWYGAGLGSAAWCKWGDITISGANTVVTATGGGGDAYDIGPGTNGATCGTVTIKEGATVNGTKYNQEHTGYL